MSNNKSIVFFGTPLFALTALDCLLKNGANILAIVTSPDKPAGRGRKITFSAIKTYALDKQLKVLQPTNLKSEDFLKELKKLNPSLMVVVAFRMLPKQVWNFPKYGTINLHASLLPNYRGAAPINWALINGEKKTGVTIFKLKQEIDTGDIIAKKEIIIAPEDNAEKLHDKLMYKGAELLNSSIAKIFNNQAEYTTQKKTTECKLAPKIFKSTCEIKFNKSRNQIIDLIRGLSPYPGAFIKLLNKQSEKQFTCKLLTAKSPVTIPFIKESQNFPFIHQTKNNIYLFLNAKECIEITYLQLEGKKKLLATEFIKGNNLSDYSIVI